MTKEVVLKSNKYGINLILDDKVPFEKLLELIAGKFEETGAFFKDAKMMISLEGRKLSDEEQLQIADTIMEHSDVTVVGFLDEDPLLEEKMKERLEAVYKADEAAFTDIRQKQKERESAEHFADSRASYEPSYTAPIGYAQAGFQEKDSMQPEEAFLPAAGDRGRLLPRESKIRSGVKMCVQRDLSRGCKSWSHDHFRWKYRSAGILEGECPCRRRRR